MLNDTFVFLLFCLVTYGFAGAALAGLRNLLGLPNQGRAFAVAFNCANAFAALAIMVVSAIAQDEHWQAAFIGGAAGMVLWTMLAFLGGLRIRHASGEHGLGRQSRWAHPWVHVCALDAECRAKIRESDEAEHVYIRPLRIYLDFGSNGVRAWGEA